jgi:hypothetical protein
MSELQADGPGIILPRAGPLPAYLALGLLQGIALWLLTRPESAGVFQGHSALLSACIHFSVTAPVAWYLLAGSPLRPLARAGVAIALATLVGSLAAYAAATSGEGRQPFSFVIALAVLSYMLVVLAAGFDPRRRWFDYPRLFEHGWRNVLLVGAAGALTGILWTVLLGAAYLLAALGVDAFLNLLTQRVVIAILSCTAFAFFVLQATLRDDALVAVRKFWLALNTWFLPLALLLGVVWVAALLAIGPEPLFQTRRAALLLFWFVALDVLFMNAAYQDGRVTPYGRPMSRVTVYAWLAVPVLAIVGLWALSLRVQQHGWSVERLWAALVGGMTLVYGVGYVGSALSRSRWMPTVENTNIVAALALAVAIVLVTGPLADFRRIAVDSQVSRLRSGEVAVAAFDFQALQREGGKWGQAALARLAEDQSLAAAARTRIGRPAQGRQDPSCGHGARCPLAGAPVTQQRGLEREEVPAGRCPMCVVDRGPGRRRSRRSDPPARRRPGRDGNGLRPRPGWRLAAPRGIARAARTSGRLAGSHRSALRHASEASLA